MRDHPGERVRLVRLLKEGATSHDRTSTDGVAESSGAPPPCNERARSGGISRLFDARYRSEQPAHPTRGFGGRKQVEHNWSALFEGIPDFHAELLATATEGDTVWSEWHWTGTRANEATLDMRGVTLFEIKNGRIVSGRLYMEEVDQAGADIDETVRRLAGGDQPDDE